GPWSQFGQLFASSAFLLTAAGRGRYVSSLRDGRGESGSLVVDFRLSRAGHNTRGAARYFANRICYKFGRIRQEHRRAVCVLTVCGPLPLEAHSGVIRLIRCLLVGTASTFIVLSSAGYLEPFSTPVSQSVPSVSVPPIQNAA